jgi:hypothetical protein
METIEKDPMNVLMQREHDYTLGFYDAMEILLNYGNQIEDSKTIPRDRSFSLLMACIEHVYSDVADAHYADIKEAFRIVFDPEDHYKKHTITGKDLDVAQQEAKT